MLNYAPVTTTPAPATVATALTVTQVRIPPAQARLLNLQPGQVVQGQVVINEGLRALHVKQQQLPLPSRATLPNPVTAPNQPLTFQVKAVGGQQVLTLVQPTPQVNIAESVAARALPSTSPTPAVPQAPATSLAPQTIQITQQQALSLGLVVGQPIQAKVAQTVSTTTLTVDNKSITLPHRVGTPGQTIALTVGLQRGQYTLTTTTTAAILPAANSGSRTNQTLAGAKNASTVDNLVKFENKQIARLNQTQMNQLGLRVGQPLTAVISHSSTGSELKLPNGTLPLPMVAKYTQASVALTLVSQHSEMGGKSRVRHFLVAAAPNAAPTTPLATAGSVPSSAHAGGNQAPAQTNATLQPRISISAGQAQELVTQQGPNIQGRVISKGPNTLLEVGNRQFNLPKGFTLSQPPTAMVVDRQGSNFILKQTQSAGFGANNLSGGVKMLTAEPMNMSMRPNIVYVEGAAAGMRISPEQARVLGLREGQVINAVVAQRADGNLLLIGNQQLAMPARMSLAQGPAAFMVSVVNGNMVLSLVDPNSANKLNQRADADARFGRLLGHAGGMHLGRLFSPGVMPQLLGSPASGDLSQVLRGLLMNSREINSASIRRSLENFGLFTESEIRQTGMAPANQGIKSALIGLRALFQSRQMETTSISGAIDELEARQIESLAQQVAGKTSLSWVIPFADQWPVYIRLSQDETPGNAESNVQKTWSVDLEAGLDEQTAMSANIRVDASKQIEVRIWLPSTELFAVAQASREELVKRLREQGVTLVTLNIFPTTRIPITDDVPEQRVGLNIDA
ncbi:MAG: hypothetical protein P8N73_00025 [Pseudomonadales bacterium]|nr:hypothetical protein [Pseudomonadales bacterium]